MIGRLTKDPEIRYTSGAEPTAVATFTLAVDRPGQKKEADFPRITVFGKQAETCEKYLKKGRMAAISGRIQTGSYKDKNGDTVYTTDVVASRVEFLDWGDQKKEAASATQTGESVARQATVKPEQVKLPDTFEMLDEDVPF